MLPNAALNQTQFMTASILAPLVVTPTTTVMDAILHMSSLGVSCAVTGGGLTDLSPRVASTESRVRTKCVLVVEHDQLIGLLTEKDMVRLISQHYSPQNLSLQTLPIGEVMTTPVKTLRQPEFTDPWLALNLLQEHGLSHLPLVDEHDRILGVLTYESVYQALCPLNQLQAQSVDQVMTTQMVCVHPETSALEVAQLMAEHHVSCVVIAQQRATSQLPSQLIPLGIVTDYDILQLQALDLDLAACPVQSAMSTPVFSVPDDAMLGVVKDLMEQHHIRRVVVTDGSGSLVGLVTQKQLLMFFQPRGLYRLVERLEHKIARLKARNLTLLQTRNRELEQRVQERTAELQVQVQRERLLAHVATQIRASLSLPNVLQTTVTAVGDFLQCDRMLIYQFDPNWSGQVVAESVASGWRSALGDRIDDSCFQAQAGARYGSGQPTAIDNIYTAGYAPCHIQLLEQYQVKANLVVPILVLDKLWGLLIGHQCQGYRSWQAADLTLLDEMAVQVAIAIQQATAYERAQAELAERQRVEASLRELAYEREQATQTLARLNQELEIKVLERTAELRQSEERWQLALRGSNDGIWDWDLTTHEVFHSSRWKTMRGYGEHEDIGGIEAWSRQLHADDYDRVMSALNAHLAGLTEFFEVEYRILRQDGSYLWVLDRGQALRDDFGQVVRMSGSARDISDRKRTEHENQRLRERLQFVLSANPAVIFTCSVTGNFGTTFISPNIQTMMGYPPEAFLSDPDFWANHIHPEDAPQVFSGLSNLFEQEHHAHEYRFQHQDGHYCWVRNELRLIRDTAGTPVEIVGYFADISDHKQIELSLQESQRFIQQIADASPNILYLFDLQEQRNIYVNREIASVLGYTPDEVQAMGSSFIPAVMHPKDLRRLPKQYQRLQAAKDGEIIKFEYRMRHANGEWRWLCSRDSVFSRDADGQVLQVIGTAEDISDRKAAELALQDSNRRYQTLTSNSPDIIERFDTEFRHVYVSPSLTQLTGLPTEAFLGKSCRDLGLSEEMVNLWEQAANQLLATGEKQVIEFETQTLNGIRSFEMLMVPELTYKGTIESILCLSRDITDYKQTAKALHQQAQRERLISAMTQRIHQSLNLSETLTTTVHEVRHALQSDRVLICRLLPDGRSQVIAESVAPGRSVLQDMIFPQEIFPPESYERYVQGRIFALSDRDTTSVLPCLADFLKGLNIRAKLVAPIIDNDILWGLLIAHQCDDPHQWQAWEIELLHHLSRQLALAIQQAQLYAQLQDSHHQLIHTNAKLLRATQLKDEFLANMSHELRTPLNAILGMTEGLQDQVFGPVTPEQRKALSTIEHSGTHLLELINDILDLAKIESGQVELTFAPTRVSQLCQSSLSFVKQQALKKRLQLHLNVQRGLPDLLLDERRIRQTLINLLNNAVKFTPEGGEITLEAVLETLQKLASDDEPRYQVRFTVIDTGIGISTEDQKKLFQPFIQIDSALNRQYAGTGLGLSLVKRLVEMHGGSVRVSSQVGVGSQFTIILPCSDLLLQTPKISPRVKPELLTTPSDVMVASPLLLLAEDNEANIATLSSYLKATGYRLVVAKDGASAIALAQSESPDLILMDIQMPGMDGLEAMRQIRSYPHLAKIPIIALTALAMAGDREKCLEAGANDYISKPVKLRQLTATIQHLLEL